MKLSAIYDTMKYLPMARPFALEKPIVLQFPVIDICNSQCQMCRIWENKKSDDIEPDQLRKGLRNDLFSEVRSVGLNGGEPTLRKDLGALTEVLFQELPKLQTISLITNAYKYEEVIARITDVGTVAKAHGGMLDVMVSLDGYGDVHDRVRGKPGNFARAQHVIDFVKSSPLVGNVRIGCTIIKENVYGLADLFEYCQSKDIYVKYRLGVPHQRLYTQNLKEPYALDAVEIYHVAEFLEGLIAHYEPGRRQKLFYRSLINQMVHGKARAAGCDWQHRGATITSKGELLYCAIQSNSLGKIQDSDSSQIFFDNAPHLRDIIATKCDSCHHDYVGIPSRKDYALEVAEMIAKKLRAVPLMRATYRGLLQSKPKQRSRFAARLAQMTALGTQKLLWPGKGTGKRVLVCGWYGTETLGDKAILAGIVDGLRAQLGDIDLTLASLHPYVCEMTRHQMPELANMTIVTCDMAAQIASDADLVVFGGGPLMAIDELADMQAIFQAARDNGVSTLVAGCGVGPFGSDWHNDSLRAILSLADARIYRDEKSRDNAASLGIDTRADLVAEDPALTWLQRQRATLPRRETPTERPVLLLGLRDFPYQNYATHLSEAECLSAKARYESAVIGALEQLVVDHPDLTIRPLPMCTNHFGDDDRWFYRRLFRGNAALAPHLDMSLLQAELAPEAYCVAFRDATASLTMRFHSVVFALGLELPTVAIDYTLGRGKVWSLAQRFGIPHRDLAQLDREFLVTEVGRQLREGRAQAPDHQPGFTAAVAQVLPGLLANRKELALS